MRDSIRTSLITTGLALILPAAAWAKEIKVAAPDFWCPFSCKVGSGEEGFTIDILRAIFEKKGIKVSFQNLNYSRALDDVRKGTLTATPSTLKEEAPDFVFPEEPISQNRYCFYTAETSKWEYKGASSLKGIKTGVITGYSYGPEVDQFIKDNPKSVDAMAGEDLTVKLIKKVMAKRNDAFVEEENLINYTLSKNKDLKIRNAGCEQPTFGYAAFSPALKESKDHAKTFSEGIKELRSSGKLKEIMAKYGLKDWK